MDLFACLRQCELFSDLDTAMIQLVADRFRPIHFQQEEIIFHEGDPDSSLYIIAEGTLTVLKKTGRGMRELKTMEPYEAFGELALITDEKRTATVKAVTDAVCLQLSKGDFEDLIEKKGTFTKKIMNILVQRLKHSEEKATQDILNSHQALIFSLANLTESRDASTGYHLYRVREYCVLLSQYLSALPQFKDIITREFIANIYIVSPLHDIGKVAIPDSILLKPGPLTPEEEKIMRTHPIIGAKSLSQILEYCNSDTFRMAYNIVRHHHERYDGNGYPDGLAGDAIPLEARITMIADVYDALLSCRTYKPSFTYEHAAEEIRAGLGTMFDPQLGEKMLLHIEEFESINRKYQVEKKEESNLFTHPVKI